MIVNKIIILFLILIKSEVAFAQLNNYFNQEYNFEISFPEGWQSETPVGPNVKVLYLGQYNSSINILVKPLVNDEIIEGFRESYPKLKNSSYDEVASFVSENFDYRNLSRLEIEALLNVMIPELKQSTRNFQLKEKGVRIINSINFAFIEFTTEVSVPGYENSYDIIQYQTNYNGNNYFITGKYLSENDFDLKPNIMNTINSFHFLDVENNFINERLDLNNNIDEENDSLILIRVITILIFTGVILLVYYKHRQNKKINFQTNSSNQGKDPDYDEATKTNTNQKGFSNSKEEYYDLEKYEEIDETNLSEEEKAKVYGKVLGLNGRLSKADITKCWKDMQNKYHPDRVSHLGYEFQIFAEKKTKDINKAYLYFKKKYNL